MTNADFLVRHPEFVTAATASITSALADAERNVSDSWDTRRDEVVALTAAHALAVSPAGRHARLSTDKGGSIYWTRLAQLKIAHACARGRIA